MKNLTNMYMFFRSYVHTGQTVHVYADIIQSSSIGSMDVSFYLTDLFYFVCIWRIQSFNCNETSVK